LTDDKGDYAGLKQESANTIDNKPVYLEADKTFIYPHRYRFGDLYGMSRLRAARFPYYVSKYMIELLNIYMEGFADPIKVGRAPAGKVKNSNSSVAVESIDYLNRRLESLSIGGAKRLTLPSETDANGKYKWDIELLESSRSNDQFLNYLNFLDIKMLNGILIPESTAMTPESGSHALEKGQEGILALSIDKEIGLFGKFVERYLINPLLEVNFGMESSGSVNFHHTKLSKNDRQLQGQILFALTQNEKVDFDIDWLSQKTGIPFVKGTGMPKEIKNIDEEGNIIPPNGITANEDKNEDIKKKFEKCSCESEKFEKRELTKAESKVQFDKIEDLFDKSKDIYIKVEAVLDDIKIKILDSLKPLIKKNDVEGIKRLELDLKNKYKNLMTAEIMDIYEESYSLAKNEVGIKGSLTAEQKALQKAKIQNIVDKQLNDMIFGIKNEVLIGLGVLKYGTIENNVKNYITQYKEDKLKLSVDVMVEQTVSDGRGIVAEDPSIETAQWSAILDKVTCPLCKSLDGMVVRVNSEEYRKYQAGKIHGNCRCIWVYISKEEVDAPEVDFKEPDKKIVDKYMRSI
jgi:hypothetical protein